jgi:hypothetical protein
MLAGPVAIQATDYQTRYFKPMPIDQLSNQIVAVLPASIFIECFTNPVQNKFIRTLFRFIFVFNYSRSSCRYDKRFAGSG